MVAATAAITAVEAEEALVAAVVTAADIAAAMAVMAGRSPRRRTSWTSPSIWTSKSLSNSTAAEKVRTLPCLLGIVTQPELEERANLLG